MIRKYTLTILLTLSCLAAPGQLAAGNAGGGNPQPAILTATATSNRAIVFPDGGALPNPPQMAVTGLPDDALPHGVAYFGSDSALLADLGRSRIHVVRVSTAELLATIDTTGLFNGTGTIAVAPDLQAALANGQSSTLTVVRAPFDASSALESVALPGLIRSYQSQAIVFDNAGRAFVYHTTGITVLDPPYTSIAFTIPVANDGSGAIAITPDGNTLLTTRGLDGNIVEIFHAPFTQDSVPEELVIPDGGNSNGIMVTPDGTKAIVASSSKTTASRLAAISAPFSSSSMVETLPMPDGVNEVGFEDVGISADSQVAIVTGNGTGFAAGNGLAAVFIRAPFTAAGAQTFAVLIDAPNPARGAGAVRFLPPGLAPGLTIAKTAPATVQSGAVLTYTVDFANTGMVAAVNAVIQDVLPENTTFLSASNGGALVGDTVVFNLGDLGPGASGQVSFSVRVGLPGTTVTNDTYTIQADGVTPVPGPPISTRVIGPQLLNLSTRGLIINGLDDHVLIGGFMIRGPSPKRVIIRALGPSLSVDGTPVPGRLPDPTLTLMSEPPLANDDWTENQAEIEATGLAPDDPLESAIVANLVPGDYTAVVRGKEGDSGLALVEVYDLQPEIGSILVNISTRGFVDTGADVLIGGLIVGDPMNNPVQFQINGGSVETSRFVIRALGPSMQVGGVPVEGRLADTTLHLHDANGALIRSNDDWRTDQEQEIEETGLPPGSDQEAAIVETLAPGHYTAIVRGKDGTTGLGLVEIYQVPGPTTM